MYSLSSNQDILCSEQYGYIICADALPIIVSGSKCSQYSDLFTKQSSQLNMVSNICK